MEQHKEEETCRTVMEQEEKVQDKLQSLTRKKKKSQQPNHQPTETRCRGHSGIINQIIIWKVPLAGLTFLLVIFLLNYP